MGQKRVYPSAFAQSEKTEFAEMMKDVRYLLYRFMIVSHAEIFDQFIDLVLRDESISSKAIIAVLEVVPKVDLKQSKKHLL